MMSVSTTYLFFADVRDGDGAAEADSSGALLKSHPRYLIRLKRIYNF
jgi:hypothetical protein